MKVAILDTGIREELRDLNNVVKYYDFVDADFREGNGNAQDKTGHGSDMVYLLHKTAPHAEIYVARVFDGDHGDVGTKEKVALVSSFSFLAMAIVEIIYRQSRTRGTNGKSTSYPCHLDSKTGADALKA